MPDDHKPSGHKDSDGKKESTNRHVYLESGVTLDIVDDLKKQHDTERREDKTAQDKQLTWTRVTAVLVAVYTLVMIWQVCLTRHSLKSTEAFATLNERPYIFLSFKENIHAIESGVINLSNGPAFTSSIIIANYGKSPALHVLEAGEVLVGDGLDKQIDNWFKEMGVPFFKTQNEKTGFYFLHNGIGVMDTTVMQGVGGVFSAVQVKGISIGIQPHLPAVTVGRIEYRDTIGNLYWTDICWMMEPFTEQPNKINLRPCTRHNEIH